MHMKTALHQAYFATVGAFGFLFCCFYLLAYRKDLECVTVSLSHYSRPSFLTASLNHGCKYPGRVLGFRDGIQFLLSNTTPPSDFCTVIIYQVSIFNQHRTVTNLIDSPRKFRTNEPLLRGQRTTSCEIGFFSYFTAKVLSSFLFVSYIAPVVLLLSSDSSLKRFAFRSGPLESRLWLTVLKPRQSSME